MDTEEMDEWVNEWVGEWVGQLYTILGNYCDPAHSSHTPLTCNLIIDLNNR